ncbi:MAG: hypothetical protein JSW67_12655 [Candidatus Latescibacterota bacterium]|nr:MAG: hypothetical protein JSW67_12655 [Candidatus Latescibacterota bacterium]
MHWRVVEEPRLRGYAVEWLEPGLIILSRRNQLFRSDSIASPPKCLGHVPAPAWRLWASRFRPAQRLLRHQVYNVVKIDDSTLFVTFDKSIGVFDAEGFRFLSGLERPCRVLPGGVASSSQGKLFFGEYLVNPERSPMRIYSWEPGAAAVEVVHEFRAGAIRHVHALHHDPFTGAIWCLTGDFDAECRVLFTTDGFKTLQTVGAGDESWRSVTLLFTQSAVYYATDAEFERNRIIRLERSSGERTTVGEIDGPVFAAIARGSDLFFAGTAELCPSQVGRSASLWHVDGDGKLEKLFALEKDRWPVGFFLPGALHLSLGPGIDGTFFFQAVALQGADGRTFHVRPDLRDQRPAEARGAG